MKHLKQVIQYQEIHKTVEELEKQLFGNLDNMSDNEFIRREKELEKLKNLMGDIEKQVDTSTKYFYPSKHGGQMVSIYEPTARYSSGFSISGHVNLSTAQELHNKWEWLSTEKYQEIEKEWDEYWGKLKLII